MYNRMTKNKEGLNALLEIPHLVKMIKKWWLISRIEIESMINTVQINKISVDVISKILIREDERKKRDQTSK